MSDRKHTAGPWRISRLTSTSIESAAGRSVCSTGGYQQSFDTEIVAAENEANARLIAAAPDLLDLALRASEADSSNTDVRTAWWEARAAVIAKAEGRS